MTKINLNSMITPKPEDTLSDDICLRSKVDTGYRCNLKCNFCYTLKNVQDAPKSFLDICDILNKLKQSGIKEVEFSGGEPTIHPNWFDLVEYANNIFEHVSVVTNGTKLCNEEFLQKSIQVGLKEILFSLHGWDDNSHNAKVGNKSFDKIIQAIELAKKYKRIVRINCVLDNTFNPLQYAKLINKLKPSQINFLPLNYWSDAKKLAKLDYTRASEHLKLCIDSISLRHPNIDINVRYIPLCFMTGYEKYCVGTYQHIFDKTDWNIVTYNGRENASTFVKKDLVLTKENMFKQAKINRYNSYLKPPSCTDCSLMYICDGIEKELYEQVNKLVPQFGNKVTDINFFNKN